MTGESKTLTELLNELAPSLETVPLQQGTTMDIINERQKTHGVYKNTAAYSQGLKDMFRASPNWSALNDGQREALDNLSVKVSRILNGDPDFKDHWDDISGYGKLGADSIDDAPQQSVDKIAQALGVSAS
jgi:hypothetical protein